MPHNGSNKAFITTCNSEHSSNLNNDEARTSYDFNTRLTAAWRLLMRCTALFQVNVKRRHMTPKWSGSIAPFLKRKKKSFVNDPNSESGINFENSSNIFEE